MKTIIIDGVEYTLTPTKQEKELFIGELNGKRYYLGPEASERMTWLDAVNWCESIGEGYELPSRIVLLMCYENDALRDQFNVDNWYWSNTAYRFNDRWVQHFLYGDQGSNTEDYLYYVRAVRVESTK